MTTTPNSEALDVTTLGEIRLAAYYVPSGRERGYDEATVVFYDGSRQVVAACPASRIRECRRTLSLRPNRSEWDLGPVDVARLAHLVQDRSRKLA